MHVGSPEETVSETRVIPEPEDGCRVLAPCRGTGARNPGKLMGQAVSVSTSFLLRMRTSRASYPGCPPLRRHWFASTTQSSSRSSMFLRVKRRDCPMRVPVRAPSLMNRYTVAVLAWAGPYARGRTPTCSTSTQPEPATHPTEAINGHYRTRQTHRQRLPQPHQLSAPIAPHRRRPRCLHPRSTLKSRLSSRRVLRRARRSWRTITR